MTVLRLDDLPSASRDNTGWPWTKGSSSLPVTMPDGLSWPRISIVTPSYNQGQFIEETLRSVLLQQYPNLEYLVLDGGSRDETPTILEKYRPFLAYLHIGPDEGQSAAIAEGFRRASGDILAWLNSDDRYQPGALKRVAYFFTKHPKTVFVNGDINFIDPASQLISRCYVAPPNWILTSNLALHTWPQQGCFWRRQIYDLVGGIDETLQFCMDRDLFIRLSRSGPTRRISGPPLADFRLHGAAKTATIAEIGQQESMKLIERYSIPSLRRFRWALRVIWRFWTAPAGVRARLHRAFGWEL